jgi:hypothetical protein
VYAPCFQPVFRSPLLQFFYFYPRDLLEIPDIDRSHCIIHGNGGGGNDEVMGARGLALSGDGGPDAGIDPADHQIEGENRK